MGLEKENLTSFPGCITVLEIPVNNSGKFNIGLDGPANKELRKEFETYFGVEFDTPAGQNFLSNFKIEINHDMMVLDHKKPTDKFTIHVLKANQGLGIVAINSEEYESSPIRTYKFILTDSEKNLEARVGKKQMRNEAIEELSKLNKGTGKRLVIISRFVFPVGSGIDSKEVAYDKLDEYIMESYTNASKFLDVVKLDPDYVDTVVKIKDCMRNGIIRQAEDGHYILKASGTKMGRTEEDVIMFCMEPVNKDFVGTGSKDDLPYSLSSQLKALNKLI